MVIRRITVDDAESFLDLLLKLDRETNFMLYEPDERQMTIGDAGERIRKCEKGSLLLGLEDNGNLVGYLMASGSQLKRIAHTVYIVIGIRKEYCGRGMGYKLFAELDSWCKENQITRQELTVMAHNQGAIHLYKKVGFEIEGTKKKSIFMDNSYYDEYYMGKILCQ